MFLQSLMKFHQRLSKILRKQNVTDKLSFVRTDNVKTVYPPTNIVCGGYNKPKRERSPKKTVPECKSQNPGPLAFQADRLPSQLLCPSSDIVLRDTSLTLQGSNITTGPCLLFCFWTHQSTEEPFCLHL